MSRFKDTIDDSGGYSPLTVYDTADPQPSGGEVFHLFAQILRVLLVLGRREDAAVDFVPAIPKNTEIGNSQPKLPYRCVFIEDIGDTLR